ncbi:hypothetical protein ElyMa_004559000 [Elysia marginata]|uniref:Uncharacterized protein n=1 Tax=Elysia marginata TaxID=1093978 RepID=A0AAV4HQW8_9GAST|nr:hypothetical protein ElyMa_004559000 [Elysia marginata]
MPSRIVGIIRRYFDHLSEETLVTLTRNEVRPAMEYGHAIWQPHLNNLSIGKKGVQRKAARSLVSMKNNTCSKRLVALGLQLLKHRRQRGGMIEVYKNTCNAFYVVHHPKIKLIDPFGRNLSAKFFKPPKSKFRLNISRSSFPYSYTIM